MIRTVKLMLVTVREEVSVMPFEEKHEYIYVPCDMLKRFFPGADKLVLDQRSMMELCRALKAEVESCEQIVGAVNVHSVANRRTGKKTNGNG